MLSILITHYNRSAALEKCIEAINNIDFKCEYEIVISDDGSEEKHLNKVKKLKYDQLILSEINRGLTNNINKGLKACNGDFILYCQEDFLLSPKLSVVYKECQDLLNKGVLDMVRLTSNFKFKHLKEITLLIDRIPNFSVKNFNFNTFRYSDHPFVTTVGFYKKYGYYLENVSGPYGETEYAIRLLKLEARIGLVKNYLAKSNKETGSVMQILYPAKKRKGSKLVWKFIRALRQHLEWMLYNPKKRKLITYKNLKKV